MSGTNGNGNGHANGNGSNGNGGNGKKLPMAGADPVAELGAVEGFPSSEKVPIEAGDLRVPVRRVHLTGGEAPFDVYDTSGPVGRRPASPPLPAGSKRTCPPSLAPGPEPPHPGPAADASGGSICAKMKAKRHDEDDRDDAYSGH